MSGICLDDGKIFKKVAKGLAIYEKRCIVCALSGRERITPLLKIGDEPTTKGKGE